jgi:CDP-diacylglycerol--inositol 3-phosphatidyltransferase
VADMCAIPQYTLFFFCAGNELFFVCIYLMHFYDHPIGIPVFTILKHLPTGIAEAVPKSVLAWLIRLTWPELVGLITFPVCFIKQVINVVQFWKASKQLCDLDLEERWRARNKKA